MSLLAAGIAGGAALGSAVYGGLSAGRMNKRAVNFQREMFEKQGQRELDYWHMQNQYNLPIEQMKRLQDAGLNPNLVYGTGADAQAAPLKAGGAPSMPSQMSEAIDFTSIAQTALATKQIQANIDRTQAETERIRQGTDIGQFELEAMREIGQSRFTKAMEAKTVNATNQDVKSIREFDTWLQMAYDSSDGTTFDVDAFGTFPARSKFVSDQVTIATRKALAEVANIKSGTALRNQQQAINELQKVILKAEADFTRAVGSKAGAGMAIQLLRTILGK